MRSLTSAEIIVAMLESYRDVCGQGELGAGSDPSDDRILMMSRHWREGSYAELYRCLYEMRNREKHLYWHVAERYLRSTTRRTLGCPECGQATREGTRHTHYVAGKRTRFERSPIVQSIWRAGVDATKVEQGVQWIVTEHRGPPMLPNELYALIAA